MSYGVPLYSDKYFELNLTVGFRSFTGYQNANYALSEVRDPVRTLKRAAPLAIVVITIVYLLVNIAYFAVVPRDELENGGRVVA